MSISLKWKTLAANAASAHPFLKTSIKCSIFPAPPDAITGIFTILDNLLNALFENPFLVPSWSIDVNKISPAPLFSTSLAQSNNLISVGITTDEIDKFCLDRIKKLGGSPAPLFYRGFPKSICTSLNRVICHGIPSKDRKLEEGDILNVDVTTVIDGWHGDSSRMYKVGNISVKAQNLCNITHSCLIESLNVIKAGSPISLIGKKIEESKLLYIRNTS